MIRVAWLPEAFSGCRNWSSRGTVSFESQTRVRSYGLMSAALGSPHEVSGAAYLPPGAPRAALLSAASGVVALKVEGHVPSVAYRREALLAELASGGETVALGDVETAALWRDIANVAPLARLADRAVWRVSVAPSRLRAWTTKYESRSQQYR